MPAEPPRDPNSGQGFWGSTQLLDQETPEITVRQSLCSPLWEVCRPLPEASPPTLTPVNSRTLFPAAVPGLVLLPEVRGPVRSKPVSASHPTAQAVRGPQKPSPTGSKGRATSGELQPHMGLEMAPPPPSTPLSARLMPSPDAHGACRAAGPP